MNMKSKKVYALLFASLLVLSTITFMLPLAEAKNGHGSISTPAGTLDWDFRRDVTARLYTCTAAAKIGGRVTGEHINLELKLNGQRIFDFHIWMGYLPTVYVSDGPWCIKINKDTWKKLMDKLEERLQTKLSKTTIKKLIADMGAREYFFPLMMVKPNCNNPSKYDVYSKLMCSGLGIHGTVSM